MYKKKSDAGADVVEIFRKVSGTVWVCLKGMLTAKTLEEK